MRLAPGNLVVVDALTADGALAESPLRPQLLSWGDCLIDGSFFMFALWFAFVPRLIGTAIFLSLRLLGDELRDTIDPLRELLYTTDLQSHK